MGYPSKSRKFLATINNPFNFPDEELILQGRDESREFLTENYLCEMLHENEDGGLVKVTG